MNSQVLIKARKVFLKDKIVENSEACPHCASKGLDNKLCYYYISLEEAIYKCARSTCLYPFERFIFKSLVDNSEYYYEEVIDGEREAYLRIPLDGQKLYESKNPISTKLFCDSQRNPDIESYDFSDFLDDFDIDSVPNEETTTDTSAVNTDFLEFLDDIEPKANDTNTDKVSDEYDIDNILHGILNESAVEDNSKIENDKPSSSPIKAESPVKQNAKLSKTIEHIQKVKNAKSIKKRTKAPETFTQAMMKARADQAKLKIHQEDEESKEIVLSGKSKNPNKTSDLLRTKLASVIKAKAVHKTEIDKSKGKKSQKKNETEVSQNIEDKQPSKNITMVNLKTALKSTNVIRPTALAKNLIAMDLTKINSNFLRQYMKAKEDKMFQDQPSCSSTTISVADEKESVEFSKNPTTLKDLSSNDKMKQNSPVTTNEIAGIEKTTVVKMSPEESMKKKHSNADAIKKANQSRRRKPKVSQETKAADVKIESIDEKLTATQMNPEPLSNCSEVKGNEKKSTSKSKKFEINSKLRDSKVKNHKEEGSEKLISKKERSCTVTSANEAKTNAENLKPENVSIKRPRKTKAEESSNTENKQQLKTKRRRISKSKTSSDEKETPSLPLLLETEPEIVTSPASHMEQNDHSIAMKEEIPSKIQVIIEIESTSSSSPSYSGSSGSLEPLLGFDPIEQDIAKDNRESFKLTSDDVILHVEQKTIHVEDPLEIPEKLVKMENENETNDSSSSKRPREMASKSKVSTYNCSIYKRALRSQKSNPKKADSLTDEVKIQQPTTSISKDFKQEILNDVEIELGNDNSVFSQELTAKNLTPVETATSSAMTSTQAENKKIKSNNSSYYRRKIFKRKKEPAFEVNKLVEDWDDSSSEKTDDQSKTGDRIERIQSNEKPDDDALSTISIESETSDSSVGIL